MAKIPDKHNVKIIGDGRATKFVNESEQTDAVFYLDDCSFIDIEGIYFEGFELPSSAWENNTTWHTAIQASNSNNLTIKNNSFFGYYTGGIKIQGSQGYHVRILNNYFENVSNRRDGDYGAIALESGTYDIHVLNNIMKGITHAGISGNNTKKLTISDNTIYLVSASSGSMGMYFINGISNSTISSNRIYESKNEGMVLTGGTNIVENNVITNNIMTADYTGITINLYSTSPNSYNNIISNNRISSFGSNTLDHGILTYKSKENQFISNHISDAEKGINLQQSPKENTVSNNIVSASSIGLQLNGTCVAVGNQVMDASIGISYGYTTKVLIYNNMFANVPEILKEGTLVTGDHLSGNY